MHPHDHNGPVSCTLRVRHGFVPSSTPHHNQQGVFSEAERHAFVDFDFRLLPRLSRQCGVKWILSVRFNCVYCSYIIMQPTIQS